MSTNNKTLAVDVLAVIDGLSAIWRDESQIVGRWDSADELYSIRTAVAELIEAVDKHLFAIRQMDEAMNDGINVQGAVSAAIGTEEMLRVALARVKGESA